VASRTMFRHRCACSLLTACGCLAVLACQAHAAAPTAAYVVDIASELADNYPPATTRLYVGRAPEGMADALRRVGFSVVGKDVRGRAVEPGYVVNVDGASDKPGLAVVVVHVGMRTMSRGYNGGVAVSGWTVGDAVAPAAMAAR
jgi:hypothetical protein